MLTARAGVGQNSGGYCSYVARTRMNQPVAILVTGGTFDKEYDELTGRLYFRDTHVGEMLRLGRSRLDISVETVMMIDSLDMGDRDRALIVERCRARPERSVVVTHGTDTM